MQVALQQTRLVTPATVVQVAMPVATVVTEAPLEATVEPVEAVVETEETEETEATAKTDRTESAA
jgi:hypothetical protein